MRAFSGSARTTLRAGWAGIAQARKEGRPHGRPPTVTKHAAEVRRLSQEGISKREIARRMGISRASVRHLLEDGSP
ncbi:MAG: helix-turn-helix domain-containing protein [Planctomycetaceae bacterium]|nr:helix-turn-helix domain-containing protein [Planctomycetaceae bacterium]